MLTSSQRSLCNSAITAPGAAVKVLLLGRPAAEALLPVNFLGAPCLQTFSGLTQLILSDLAQAPPPPEVRHLPSLSSSSDHVEMQLESGCDCDQPGGEEGEATWM